MSGSGGKTTKSNDNSGSIGRPEKLPLKINGITINNK